MTRSRARARSRDAELAAFPKGHVHARPTAPGVVVGSELDASKHAKAIEHLREAGLDAFTDVRLGDALQTLADVEAPVDMVLLDGWKDTYPPV